MILVTIDPGLRGCGVAAWRDAQLIQAAYITPREPEESLANAVEAIAAAVVDYAHTFRAVLTGQVEEIELVIERPQTYRGRASEGDANDLIAVAMVVGAIGVYLGEPWASATPHEWKGNAPKRVTEARARDKLSPRELSCVVLPGRDKKLCSNVWDAVGIGLWKLGR